MEVLFAFVEGGFGALLMVTAALVALIGLPVSIVRIIISLVRGTERSLKFYLAFLGVPVLALGLSVGLFVVRGFLAVHFAEPELISSAVSTIGNA